MHEDRDAYLPLKALSSYSGLSVRTLRGHLSDAARPLPHYRVGARIVVRQSEFDEWIRAFRTTETSHVDAIVAAVLNGL